MIQEVPNPDQTWYDLWWAMLLPDAISNVIYFKRILDLAMNLPLFELFLSGGPADRKCTGMGFALLQQQTLFLSTICWTLHYEIRR